MRLASLLGLFLVPVFALDAGAATYAYTSKPYSCEYEECSMTTPGEVLTGSLTIDETKLPPGMLVNATISLFIFETGQGEYWTYYEKQSETIISSAAGSFGEVLLGDGWMSTVVGSLTGYLDYLIGNPIHEGDLTLRTGDQGQIISWSGGNMDGGDNDTFFHGPGSSAFPGYDGFADGSITSGPGTWTGRSDLVALAPVPLPAALPLLTLALGALGIAARRRKA